MRSNLSSPAHRRDHPASNIDQKEWLVSHPLLNITLYIGLVPNLHVTFYNPSCLDPLRLAVCPIKANLFATCLVLNFLIRIASEKSYKSTQMLPNSLFVRSLGFLHQKLILFVGEGDRNL